MAQTPSTEDLYVGDGVRTVFPLTFPYLSADEVFVSVDDVNTPYIWVGGSTASVQLAVPPVLGAEVKVYRNTKAIVPLHVFAGGVPFLPRYIDDNNRQLLFCVQEAVNSTSGTAAEALVVAEEAKVIAERAEEKVDGAIIDSAYQLRQDLLLNTADPGGTSIVNHIANLAGAVQRTLRDRLDQTALDPRDFGAKGDGSQDDTLAIQTAINVAAAMNPTCTVFLHPGLYSVTNSLAPRWALSVPTGVSFIGAGGGSSKIVLDPATVVTTASMCVIHVGTDLVPASRVLIKDLDITCNQVAIGGAYGGTITKYIQGIVARYDVNPLLYSSDITIRECAIHDSNVGIGCSKDTTVDHNTPTRLANQHRRWRVIGCLIDSTTNKAIELQECNLSLIGENSCLNVVDGPQVINGSRDIVIYSNTVEYRVTGINLTHNVRRISVLGNTCRAVAATALASIIVRSEPHADASAVIECTIAGNTCVDEVGSTTVFALLAKTQNVSVQVLGLVLANNTFAGIVRLYDIGGVAKMEARDWEVVGNRISTLVSVPNSTDNVTQINMVANSIVVAYTHHANTWTFTSNTFKGVFTLSASATQTYHQGNRASSFSDLGSANRQGVNDYGTVQRVEAGTLATVAASTSVSFTKPFKAGTVPIVTFAVVTAASGSDATLNAPPTNTGFVVNTFVGANGAGRTVFWIAVGVD